MKRKNLILSIVVLFVGAFSISGCSTQKNYNMSFKQVVSLLENQSKEMMDMFFNVDVQEKALDLSTNVDTDGVNLDLDIQTQAKIDYESKAQDVDFSFDADVKMSDQELDFTTSGALKYSVIGDNMYLKLSKFALKGPSASDLAMVTMIVNSFKGQWFKLSMSGLSMSKAFDMHSLYNEKLGEMANEAGDAMINEGSGVYDGIFSEYKGYNAWKYSVDKEKFDKMLQIYVDVMNEFYSGFFTQYAQTLGTDVDEMGLFDFGSMFSGITYDNLQGYFIIVGKNEVVETMENANINIDGTGFVVNYYYGKDGVYFNTNTADGENIMSIVARRNGKTYNVEANMNSMMKIKGDVKFNQFSKKAGVDIDFDLVVSVDSESMNNSEESVVNDMEIPFKGTYKVKNIDKFSLQEPSDAVDLMEMLGGFLGMGMADEQLTDDFEWDDEYEYESFEDVQELE